MQSEAKNGAADMIPTLPRVTEDGFMHRVVLNFLLLATHIRDLFLHCQLPPAVVRVLFKCDMTNCTTNPASDGDHNIQRHFVNLQVA